MQNFPALSALLSKYVASKGKASNVEEYLQIQKGINAKSTEPQRNSWNFKKKSKCYSSRNR